MLKLTVPIFAQIAKSPTDQRLIGIFPLQMTKRYDREEAYIENAGVLLEVISYNKLKRLGNNKSDRHRK